MADGYGFGSFAVVSPFYPLDGDYPTIQDAINDGAKGIYVKSGLYLATESITVPSGVFIFGESLNDTIIDFNNDDWGFVIEGFGVRIWGLRVVNSINALGAFNFNVATNAEVKNCRVEACVRGAIFASSTYCTFDSNWVQGCHLEGIFVDATSTDNKISCNRFIEGANYGIILEGAFNKILDNSLAGNLYDGILVSSKMNTIHGNTCNQNANGIFVAKQNGDNNSLMGNICNNNAGYGININSLENSMNNVIGNVCRENGVADIRFVPGNQVGFNDALTIV